MTVTMCTPLPVSVQISGKGGHKGLAFTGLHLCDTALMQDDTADDLYTVMTHTEYAPCCFTAGGKCLRQKLVECFAVLVALLEIGSVLARSSSSVSFLNCSSSASTLSAMG